MKIDDLVNLYYDKLNQSDLHIWKYINAHRKESSNLTIDELASRCNVSRTTILRFAQKLSLKGYSELKVYLKWENKEVNKETDSIESVSDMFKNSIDEMEKNDYHKACKMIYDSKRVFIYGTGFFQTLVAQDLKRVFLSGKKCFSIIDGIREIDLTLDALTSEDLVIIISYSGESSQVKSFAKQLLIRDIPFISITQLKTNNLARLSNESIYINTKTVNVGNNISYNSTNLFFIFVELFFLKYMNYKNAIEGEKDS